MARVLSKAKLESGEKSGFQMDHLNQNAQDFINISNVVFRLVDVRNTLFVF
jgi:hypothetical protein